MQVEGLDEQERKLEGEERSVQFALYADNLVNQFLDGKIKPMAFETCLARLSKSGLARDVIESHFIRLWSSLRPTLKATLLRAAREEMEPSLARFPEVSKSLSLLEEHSANSHSATLDSHVLQGRKDMQTATGTTGTTGTTKISRRSDEDLFKEVSSTEDAERLFNSSPAFQKEFGTAAVLFAYCDAVRRGVVRWQGPPATTAAPAKPVFRGIDDSVLLGLAGTEARAAELWERSEALRAEFSSPQQLWGYIVARQSGQASILRPRAVR